MGILKFWGVPEAKNLQSALGITIKKKPITLTNNMRNNNRNNPNRKANLAAESEEEDDEKSIDYFISRAARSKIGSTARLYSTESDDNNTNEINTNDDAKETKNELFVVPVSGMRGLHLQDVQYVLILEPPRTMDEYLHVAGRTGRAGNRVSTGTVVTYVNLEQLKRLQSWQTPLGIIFDIQYQ
jgi:superfamily II DNA helicase RecQ